MTAQLKIDLSALARNFNLLNTRVTGEVAGVVKADAYGLGMAPVSQTLWDSGCTTYFVATATEGLTLRTLLPKATIYIFEGVQATSKKKLLDANLIPVIYNHHQLQLWKPYKQHPIALQVETGMNRLGFDDSTESGVFADFEVCLLVTHYANADNPDDPYNQLQRDRFTRFRKFFSQVPCSLANSAASAALDSSFHGDIVRPGIGLFGGSPGAFNHGFENVATLEGQIVDIRQIAKGERIGYGSSYTCPRQSTIAAIGIGYADGVRRALSNCGQVSLNGSRANIVGRISMDVTQVNLEGINPEIGSWVQFFGNDIYLQEVSSLASTIDYEILTGIGARVERLYSLKKDGYQETLNPSVG
jgi:alanine racemase